MTCYTEGFSHFVTSMTAPVASGWSVAGWGLHPLTNVLAVDRGRRLSVVSPRFSRQFGSKALIAGSNSIIGCAASHMRSKCASNFTAAPASRITIRSLSCRRSPLALKFAEPVRSGTPRSRDQKPSRSSQHRTASLKLASTSERWLRALCPYRTAADTAPAAVRLARPAP